MLSFKDFLKEGNSQNYPILVAYVEMEQRDSVNKISSATFTQALKERGEREGFTPVYDQPGDAAVGTSFKIMVQITNQSLLRYNMHHLAELLANDASQFGEISDVMVYMVHVPWPPAFPVTGTEDNDVVVEVLAPNSNLKDLPRLLPECESLTVIRGQNLSGVLSLLNYEGSNHIEVTFSIDPVAGQRLNNILSKHLEGDRDILACQEELIEAGLEEYANL